MRRLTHAEAAQLLGVCERTFRRQVERCESGRIEFWSVHRGELTIKAVNEALGKYLADYHNVRPHQALGWLTPNEFQTSLAMVARAGRKFRKVLGPFMLNRTRIHVSIAGNNPWPSAGRSS